MIVLSPPLSHSLWAQTLYTADVIVAIAAIEKRALPTAAGRARVRLPDIRKEIKRKERREMDVWPRLWHNSRPSERDASRGHNAEDVYTLYNPMPMLLLRLHYHHHHKVNPWMQLVYMAVVEGRPSPVANRLSSLCTLHSSRQCLFPPLSSSSSMHLSIINIAA